MRYAYLCAALTIAVVLLVGVVVPTYAASGTENCRYFPETGHYVCDEFLAYFNTRGGTEIFGYPRSKAYFDAALGRTVQYFQRARLEMHPENPEPYRVQQGLLADELGYINFPPAAPEDIPSFNSAFHQYFPETGHVVSFGFLQFYRERGGLDVFGYPRSEFMYQDGYIVQYFQRARMEWHPDSQPKIVLTDLGDIYIERIGVPQVHLKPELDVHAQEGVATPSVSVVGLTASASVRHVIIGKDELQTVFVYVTDQHNEPVENAIGQVVVHYPTGDQTLDLLPTNPSGFTSQSFYIAPTVQPGQQVEIDIFVEYQTLDGETNCFFLPWW